MNDKIEKKFAQVRGLFPHTGNRVYLNSAAYGPFCLPVKQAMEDNIDLRLSAERDDTPDAFAASDHLRGVYARMIGARKNEVGIGLNTTFGLNIAAYGLPLRRGDEVLISDIEFPAIVYTWRAAAEARGWRIKFIKSRNRVFDLNEFERALSSKSRVLALSSVQYFDGYKNDLESISEICRKHGLYFVVDGIQGMGVEPINVRKAGIDIFASGCQKWMLAPQGCGFFYLSESVQKVLTPPFMSWLGVDWKLNFTDLFRYDLPWLKSAGRFEMGYYVILNLLGMKAAASLFVDLGIRNIQRHNHALIDRLVAYLRPRPFYTITSSLEKKHRSSIFSFTCPGYKELYDRITKSRIILSEREGSIRISAHLFNNEDDIDRLIAVLDDFSRRRA